MIFPTPSHPGSSGRCPPKQVGRWASEQTKQTPSLSSRPFRSTPPGKIGGNIERVGPGGWRWLGWYMGKTTTTAKKSCRMSSPPTRTPPHRWASTEHPGTLVSHLFCLVVLTYYSGGVVAVSHPPASWKERKIFLNFFVVIHWPLQRKTHNVGVRVVQGQVSSCIHSSLFSSPCRVPRKPKHPSPRPSSIPHAKDAKRVSVKKQKKKKNKSLHRKDNQEEYEKRDQNPPKGNK